MGGARCVKDRCVGGGAPVKPAKHHIRPVKYVGPSKPHHRKPARDTCEKGWSYYKNHCYTVLGGRLKYSEGVEKCTQQDAQPVWFNQTDEEVYRKELKFANGVFILSAK
ncbi:unnamed protein product [Anisakis simplex]|uniref:C-type lectin domain-containing protein n=1 Tax=Anisakis simplex TaxID=6269 RepID=A0A0M3JIB5_ANISI|nr:unnamed protein product [Anisakis simplex]